MCMDIVEQILIQFTTCNMYHFTSTFQFHLSLQYLHWDTFNWYPRSPLFIWLFDMVWIGNLVVITDKCFDNYTLLGSGPKISYVKFIFSLIYCMILITEVVSIQIKGNILVCVQNKAWWVVRTCKEVLRLHFVIRICQCFKYVICTTNVMHRQFVVFVGYDISDTGRGYMRLYGLSQPWTQCYC